ncbi:MAG: 2-oxo-4-hydroxy-4-carboxy-5-ureidoimidazoline decarboxylase [Pseudomonadota bacterium]
MPVSITHINNSSDREFVETLAGIYEHSPWVAELVVSQKPFESRHQLHQVMAEAMHQSPEVQRMELLCRHPELAGKEAAEGKLTDDSRREQAGAGLNHCSREELDKIAGLNQRYRKKFDFPFIIAVTGLNKQQIISAMETRLSNDSAVEFETALREVEKIALIRLSALIDN